MNIPTSTQTLSLSDVKKQFDDWRNQRGKMGSFPDELWRAAVKLLECYKVSEIIRELRITKHQLEDRKNRYQTMGEDGHSFVALQVTNNVKEERVTEVKSVEQSVSVPIDSFLNIELHRPNGTKLIIGGLPREEMQTLITAFMG